MQEQEQNDKNRKQRNQTIKAIDKRRSWIYHPQQRAKSLMFKLGLV